MKTSEQSLTRAVEAAARAAFDRNSAEVAASLHPSVAAHLTDWEQSGAVVKHGWRQIVLPLVVAALESLPEPAGSDAWLQGLYDGPV